MFILGVNAIGYHDASACLVEDGRLIAFAEEERFTRLKHAIHQYPYHAVNFCLHQAEITLDDVDYVATPWLEGEAAFTFPPGYSPDVSFGLIIGTPRTPKPAFVERLFGNRAFRYAKLPRIAYVSHHLAHASSAFRCSGFDEAAILVVDGEGDRVATTLAYGKDNGIHLIGQFPTAFSLGQFYACITAYVGLGEMGEGKTMGLAAYGKPSDHFDIVSTTDSGYEIALDVDPSILWDPSRVNYLVLIDAWMKFLTDRFGPSNSVDSVFDLRTCRARQQPLLLQHHMDIAASAQATLEHVTCHLVNLLRRATHSKNLVIAGGVGLNCAANGKVVRSGGFEHFFVQPVAGDAGAPIGAALELWAHLGNRSRFVLDDVALGPEFSNTALKNTLNNIGIRYRTFDDIGQEVAGLLATNKVVGWFQGRMEGGPRALGHRSILANPVSSEMRDRVNQVKGREQWRPIAPSLREEAASSLLVSERFSPFMIISDEIKQKLRHKVPAVVHVDGSARPQTVSKQRNPQYWHMLKEFEDNTGLPCVVNSSFNAWNEPIVCTPLDAIRTFYSTGLDALALGPHLITKDS